MARCESAWGWLCGWLPPAAWRLPHKHCAVTLADGVCEPVQEDDKAEGTSPPPRTGVELKGSFVEVGASPGTSRRFSST